MIRRTPKHFDGASVVVTGASSGIGRATAVALAERGARVTLAARSAGALEEVAARCRADGGQALAVPTDVSDDASVEHLAARAAGAYGSIDAWVNNAAVMAYGRFEDTPGDVHRHVIETNLIGAIECARTVLPYFREQGKGVLVNVASQYARITSPYVSAYVISKFGMLGFSEVLRQELADSPKIKVVTVLPGSVDTPIFRHAGNYVGRQPRPIPPVADPQRVVKAILRAIDDPKAEIAVGQVARLLSLAHALAPGLYDRLAPRAMDLAGYRNEEVERGPGNVFEPSRRWQQVEGGWRRRRRVALAGLPVAAATITGLAALRARGAQRGS